MARESRFPTMTEIVPEGVIGVAKIEHREVPEFGARMAAIRGQRLSAGTFCYLSVGGTLYMSDTDNERFTNYDVLRESHGNVLIAGLGIGMILHPILAKREVTSVTVIEKYQDVVDLVGPTVRHPKLIIECADIYEWKPSKTRKFNVIYFDVWPSQSTDDLADMAKLHQCGKSWLDRSDADTWMNSWNREALMDRKRRENRMRW